LVPAQVDKSDLTKRSVLYCGLVRELPVVYGKVLELPEKYFIAHYGSRGSISARKTVFYALLEFKEYYQYPFIHCNSKESFMAVFTILFTIDHFTSFSYGLPHQETADLNLCTITKAIYPYSFYEIIESILMQFRSRKKTQISRLVLRYGLIRLLKPDKLRTYGKVLVRC